MGDNIYNQDPISVKRKGINSEIQFANNGGDDLDSHPNVYVTSDGGLNATYFTGDGGNLSNITGGGGGSGNVGPGTVNRLAYFNTSNTITSADFITVNTTSNEFLIDGDLTVAGNIHSVDHLTTNDAIIVLASNNISDLIASGIMLNRPGANVFYGITGGSKNNFSIGLTNDDDTISSITMLDSNDFQANIHGSVAIKGNNQLLFTDNILIHTENSISSRIAIGNNSSALGHYATTVGSGAKADGNYSMAIGSQSNAHAFKTIVFNASGSTVTSTQSEALYIKPIRGVPSAISNVLSYSQDGEVLDTKVISINGTDATITNNIYAQSGIFNSSGTSIETDLSSNVLIKLDQLSSVNINTPVEKQILQYNGVEWINDWADFTTIKATANVALVKGDVVYVYDGQGDKPIVDKADASEQTKMPAIGVILANTGVGGDCDVVTFGVFSMKLPTGFNPHEILYVSNVAAGKLSNVKPIDTTGSHPEYWYMYKGGKWWKTICDRCWTCE